MRKVLLGLILWVALLFSCHSSVPVRRDRGSPPLENAVRATVAFIQNRTETAADQTAQVYCSGFFISERRIASALHCFQQLRVVRINGHILQIPTVYNPTGTVVQFVRYGDINMLSRSFLNDELNEAEVVYVDLENDLAILSLREGTRDADNVIRLSTEPPELAQRVILAGHPHELVWSVVDGIVSRNVMVAGELIVIQASIPLTGGYSGGPLLLPDGRVIGVASSYMGDMHHLSLFVPSRLIARDLFLYEFSRLNIPNH